MSDNVEPCPSGAHVHTAGPTFLLGGYAIVDEQGEIAALSLSGAWAERIAELINRHGLVDVPDDVRALAPWPAPDPSTRLT